jgi:hypothetical protein
MNKAKRFMRPGKGVGQVEREGQTGPKKKGAQVCRLPPPFGQEGKRA